MGQKINPLGFRLGTTQDHHSFWFSQPKNYSEGLEEDQKIRDSIQNYVKRNIQNIVEENIEKIKKKNRREKIQENRQQIVRRIRGMGLDPELSGIACIKIQKKIDLIKVRIYLAFPLVLEESPRVALQMNLEKELNKEFNSVNLKIRIATTTIEQPYGNPIILAQYLALQLKERVPFRKAMALAIEKTKQTKTKGIRIQIAGRLDGREKARVQWVKKGRVPLQTIRAKIDYCSYPVRTIYGVLGIKIWIFRDKN